MVVRVLGPMETGSETLSPRERAILAALIVRAGTAVDPDELAAAVWGDEPPATWAQQVRNAVARIRKALGSSSVETVGSDYRLGLDPDAIDAVRFERLVSTARGHALRDEHDRAVDAYRRALALWRGKPLQDVRDWEPAIVEVLRLESIRQGAEEELLDSRLQTGEAASVIPDAERLVRDDPMRESRWAILALANYRADRQSDALATLREARRRLDEELGIEPSARLAELERAILRRAPALDAVAPLVPTSRDCPYPGLRAFRPEEAELFFGREDDVEAVLEVLGRSRLVAIAGPSGTGKSSLLLAGVIPRLRARGRQVEVVRPTSEAAGDIARGVERADVIAIDQSEELLHVSDDVVAEVAQSTRAFMDAGGTVLLTIRSDALDAMRAVPVIGERLGTGVFLLGPLTETALRDAVVEPAGRAGLRLEPGLVELVVRDSGDRSATLPHLSHALRETWIRREGVTLTVEGYRTTGGIAGAIAKSAEEVVAELAPHEREICRSLLLRMIDRGADGSSTRRRVAIGPLIADAERLAVLERLTAARLVTIDGDSATIAHEAVARAWPRLDAWLEESVESVRTMRAVESSALAWDADGRSDDDLPRGARLHAIAAWRAASDSDVTPLEGEYIERALAGESARAAADRAAALREQRQNRRLRWALAGAAALLVAAVVGGGLAAVRGQEATAAAEDAKIEALVATSLSLRSSDRDLAALLAVEAHRRWPDDDRARSALFGVMTAAGGLISRIDHPGAMIALAILRDGDTALRAIEDDAGPRLEIIDLESDTVIRTLEAAPPVAETGEERTIAITPDGRTAVVQTSLWADERGRCCDNHFLVVDLDSGRALPASQVLRARTSGNMAFSSDGTAVFVANPVTLDLQSIDLRTGQARASSPDAFENHSGEDGVSNAVANVGGGLIAVGTPTAIVLYDEVDLSLRGRLQTEGDLGTTAIVADRAGGLFAAGQDGVTHVDVATGVIRWVGARVEGRPCWHLAVDPEFGKLYCSRLGSVSELYADSGRSSRREFAALIDEPASMFLRSAARELVLLSELGQVQRWRLDGSGPASTLVARGRQLVGGLGADGSVAITAPTGGGSFQAWDVDADRPVGKPAEWLDWASPDVMTHRNDDGVDTLLAEDGGEVPVSRDIKVRFEGGIFLQSAPPGAHAFAFVDGFPRFVAVDPATGEAGGRIIVVHDVQDGMYLIGVSESADAARVALTYYDSGPRTTQTAVFDARTGDLIAQGAVGTEGNAIVGSDRIVTVSDTALTLRDLETLEEIESFPKPFSSGNTIEVSDDGRTMLVVGWDNRAALYGLAQGVKLGDTMDAPSPELAEGAHLSRDGSRLVVSSPEGLLVWDLDPALHAEAACAIAGRQFTAVEWRTYFGDEAQRPTCEAG
ncbi:BTAD domain-containing putative transcriptional regulator [Microbacterium sp. NPDC019599]|uniref:nSTAND1 domain-containing NTPase n=1 Tax=Microbacterium sp. NPDC019599 TaxID=3154690 RepID=UPI00340EFA4E